MTQINAPFYVVLCDDGRDEAYVSETPLSRMDRAGIARDIRQGQYGEILKIIEIVLPQGICRDAIEDADFAEAIDEVSVARAELMRRAQP